MGRRPAPRVEHMVENEIQELESMTLEQVETLVARCGTSKTSELIMALLRSYRSSAHVSNAAWRVVKESEDGGTISAGSFRALRAALHAYSPLNFLPFRSDVEYAAATLESLYNTLESWNFNSPRAMLSFAEHLYERITQLRTRPAAE